VFYSFVTLLTRFLLFLLTDCRVYGLENVPRTGPLIVVSNHLHNVDPPVVGSLVGRQVRFMAKEELFEVPVFKHCVRAYGAFRVRRGATDLRALRVALDILRNGGVVGMFPEGHRSRDSQLQRAQVGAALIELSRVPLCSRLRSKERTRQSATFGGAPESN